MLSPKTTFVKFLDRALTDNHELTFCSIIVVTLPHKYALYDVTFCLQSAANMIGILAISEKIMSLARIVL